MVFFGKECLGFKYCPNSSRFFLYECVGKSKARRNVGRERIFFFVKNNNFVKGTIDKVFPE